MNWPTGDGREVKREVTTGNLQSIATTVLSWATVLVTIVLAYARLTGKDDLIEAEIARIKIDVARQEAAVARQETAGVIVNDKIATILGDIRVIREILEGQRRPPLNR